MKVLMKRYNNQL